MAIGTDKQTLIESVFLARIIESKLFGDPVEGLPDELSAAIKFDVTPDSLNRAATEIVTTRKARSFPSLPDCLAEIERFATRQESRMDGYAVSGITKDTYGDMAIAHGRKAGKFEEIERKKDLEEWAEWKAYFASIGMRGSASMMATCERWVVPARRPSGFDAGFVYRPEPVRQADAGPREITTAIRNAMLSMRAYSRDARPKPSPEEYRRQLDRETRAGEMRAAILDGDEAAMAKLKADNASISLSNESRVSLGLPVKQGAA